jgi:CheY-like chemotaxis protein
MALQEPVSDRTEDREQHHAAVTAWQRQAELLTEAAQQPSTSREERMDAQRRLEALERTQQALLERTSGPPAPRTGGPRAVLVHRNEWLREQLALHLSEHGVQVLAEAGDGAEGLGIVIAEQPDVVVVEDRLPSMPASELVAAIREFASGALVAVQVEHQEDVTKLVDSGARAVFSRRIPPAVMAEQLAELLVHPGEEPFVLS